MKISHTLLQSFFKDAIPTPQEIEKSFIFKAFEVESVTQSGDDYVYDIKILPDRAHDCLSHIGIARELSAQFSIPMSMPDVSQVTTTATTEITITPSIPFTRRYIGVVVDAVTVTDSPEWLKKILTTLGVKSINNVVDITNYLLHLYGTPLHVFDFDKMNPSIVIRSAHEGETITTLDGAAHILTEGDMLITDGVYPLAIAGVKGGVRAEVTKETKKIVFEIANFDPVSVRKTARRLSLLTDAAKRFENDFSSQLLDISMQHALHLCVRLSGGTPQLPVDHFLLKEESIQISLKYNAILDFLGITIPEDTVKYILESIGCVCEKNLEGWNVTPPYWRKDMRSAADCIDELARLYGYEHIPDTVYPIATTAHLPVHVAQSARLRMKLQHAGFWEIYTYTFAKKGIRSVLSPLAKDKTYLRNALKEQFVAAVQQNGERKELLGITGIRAFEIGTVFFEDREALHIIASATQESRRIFDEENIAIISQDTSVIEGEIKYDLTPIPFDKTLFPVSPKGNIAQWSLYPYIVRDISVWVPESVTHSSLQELLNTAVQHNSVPIRCIDEYHKEGRVSYTFRIVFQSFERTLTDTEVETFMAPLYEALRTVPELEIR